MKSLLEFMNRDRLRKYKVDLDLDSSPLVRICDDKRSVNFIFKKCGPRLYGKEICANIFVHLKSSIDKLVSTAKDEHKNLYDAVLQFLQSDEYILSLQTFLWQYGLGGVLMPSPLAHDVGLAIVELCKTK